ncbi:MAG TPA: EamA family transporter [Caldithrix abyssi]|uniref:EamA family transporter n=1 Tax=Caldithrix abyssi TaxID=187145 RepID=A0A7V5LKC9_CALAY|nr:EamA family transporter [Caldithrix abyssi]
MVFLFFVSLLWAFSFGLIKGQLTSLDPFFVAFARLLLSFLVFLPFFRWQAFKRQKVLLLVGGLQFGLMYMFYIYSYQWLMAYQVALFTIFTPIYITLLDDFLQKRFHWIHFSAAVLSVIGTGIIFWKQFDQANFLKGFVLVQASNFCFATGQILYRKYRSKRSSIRSEAQLFAALYLGGALITGLGSAWSVNWSSLVLMKTQILTLMYLGIIASGIGFFLWNYGALKVNAGTLAIFNNLKIPLAVLVAFLVFGESANLLRLSTGASLLGLALWFNEKFAKTI